MDDTTSSTFLPQDQLASLLPGYRLDPKPVSTTGMSQVYLATDTRLHHRKVAVKIMADYLAAHPGYRKRFLREIQLMASLEHPNIIYVITAAGERDRLLYLVMPRAEGDLRNRLRAGPLDLAETVHTVTQVAKALDHAHDRGVVHRDVKPGNILFGQDGHVYLCDFGVAKVRSGEDLTTIGETIGTRRYTAPEVYGAGQGEAPALDEAPTEVLVPTTPRERSGDVYSLGAVLYHCLTGRRPFDHLDDQAAEAAQRRGDTPRVSETRPDLPSTLDAVMERAMHLNPDARYRSCGELADALARAVGLSGDRSALPVLRDILARMPQQPAAPDRTVAAPMPIAPVPVDNGPRLYGIMTTLIALMLVGGMLAYLFLDRERNADLDADAAEITEEETTVEETSTLEPPAPLQDPVTGDERAERRPMAGECLAEEEEEDAPYVVVACDSPDAVEWVYRIVTDPEDPNPDQPEHDDAAWLACGSELGEIDYHYYWSDSANRDGDREWNPATDRIYFIICYKDL